MRIMITGGGTGGHSSPAVAIIEELRKRDEQLLVQWVGRSGNIEERVAQRMDVPFRHVPVEAWPRRRSLRRLWALGKLGWSVLRAWQYLHRFRPQLVIGVGGYVSLPLLWAAQRMKIPTAIHEQNRLMGMANRVAATRAARIFLSYEHTTGSFDRTKARFVGNPVRSGFSEPPASDEAKAALGLVVQLPVVLVCGGSQGARSINAAMKSMLSEVAADEAQFLWMTGAQDAEDARVAAKSAKARVHVFVFIDDMVTAMAASDLVVSRAGASSTAELAMLGKPSLLIPYPHAAENHQEENARAFEEAGAAAVLLDRDCDGARLWTAIRGLLVDPERLQAMGKAARGLAKPGAAEAIVEECFVLVFPV